MMEDNRQLGLDQSTKLTDNQVYLINNLFETYIRENDGKPISVISLYRRLEGETNICLFGKRINEVLDFRKFSLKGSGNELIALRYDYKMKKSGNDVEKLLSSLNDFIENSSIYSKDDVENLCNRVSGLYPNSNKEILEAMKTRYLTFVSENLNN